MLVGIDIGSEQCTVTLGKLRDGKEKEMELIAQVALETNIEKDPLKVLNRLGNMAEYMRPEINGVGISCDRPIDRKGGLVLSSPELPHWDGVPIVEFYQKRFGVPTALQSNANAYALAEWKLGAGEGSDNMIFLKCGCGMGAGLILNGSLYNGSNNRAGAVGHMRITRFGPVGCGKMGSLAGFCCDAGISQMAQQKALEMMQQGEAPAWVQGGQQNVSISAKELARYADQGDQTAIDVFRMSGKKMGQGLAILIDLLNPERIVIDGPYARSGHLMKGPMEEVLRRECLPQALRDCIILPAQLGDHLRDYAALAVALDVLERGVA